MFDGELVSNQLFVTNYASKLLSVMLLLYNNFLTRPKYLVLQIDFDMLFDLSCP